MSIRRGNPAAIACWFYKHLVRLAGGNSRCHKDCAVFLVPQMSAPRPAEENNEQRLITYIDVPYFRNNPAYIEMWRKHYEERRDPQILLLMYHKQISTHYHWIYIELARHFARLGKAEISHYILAEALRNKVYDAQRLRDAMARLPAFQKKYARGDVLCILNQRNINALGRLWNRYEERFFYQDHLQSGCLNFEQMKILEYERASGACSTAVQTRGGGREVEHSNDPYFIKTIYFEDCAEANPSGHYNTTEEYDETNDRTDEAQIAATEDGGNASACGEGCVGEEDGLDSNTSEDNSTNGNAGNGECNEKSMEEVAVENEKENYSNAKEPAEERQPNNESEHSITKTPAAQKEAAGNEPAKRLKMARQEEAGIVLYEIQGILEKNAELVINDFIHLVQEAENDSFLTLRIAKDSNTTQTIAGRSFCLKKTSRESICMLAGVASYEYCASKERLFVIFECDKIENIRKVLEYCDSKTCLFYLSQVLAILNKFREKGIVPAAMDFFIDSSFNAVLCNFEMERLSEGSDLQIRAALSEMFDGFGVCFEGDLLRLHKEIECKISKPEIKRDFLKHKTIVLGML